MKSIGSKQLFKTSERVRLQEFRTKITIFFFPQNELKGENNAAIIPT